MKTIQIILILASCLISGCRPKETAQNRNMEMPSHNGKITISGAYALMPLMERLVSEYQKLYPGAEFVLNSEGTGEALSKLSSSKIDLFLVSSDLTPELDSVYWSLPVARVSTVIIMNKKNPYINRIFETGITADNLAEFFTGMKTCWGDIYDNPEKNPVSVYFRDDMAGTTDMLARFLWINKNELKGTGINGEDKLIDAIRKDPLGLGYCNFIYTFESSLKQFDNDIVIVPLDNNRNCLLDPKENFYSSFKELQRAMWLGKYPCILNRELKIVASQKPTTKELYDFIKWIFTGGQKFIPEMGYMELRSSEIKYCISYLEN